MTATRVYRTGPDHFAGTRPSTDADRLRTYGPIQPMDTPGAFETTRIICRIGLVPAVRLTAFVAACVGVAFLIILTLFS